MSYRGSRDIAGKVYVGDLPSGASRQELEDSFRHYGYLKNVWVARNPPGFAFVEFEDERDARDAVKELDGSEICGRKVRVELSSGRSRPRGRFGGGGRGPPPRRDIRDEKCYECGEKGHFARDCYNRSGSGRRSSYRGRGRSHSRSRSRSRSYSPKRRYSRSKSRSRSPSRSGGGSPGRD